MKLLRLLFAALLLLPASLSAQIYADFKTSKGDFTYLLYYSSAPIAVANFIGLAEGSRPWIEEPTGSVKVNKPFYNGLTFHRVINGIAGNPNFQIAQAGSPNSLGTDGPGYNFRDEPNNTFGQAFLLAMANAGPHSNGSQFFLTGTMVIPVLNGKHTVFGELVAKLPGQTKEEAAAILGTILASPTDLNNKPTTPVVINSIAIRRVGTAANNFNINAQSLPTITRPKPVIEFIPGISTKLNFTPPVSSLTRFYYSSNLVSWQPLSYFIDADDTPSTTFNVGMFTGNPSSCFFNLSTVNYPANAFMPSTLNNRVLTVSNEYGIYQYQFLAEPNVGSLQACGWVYHTYNGTTTSEYFAVNALEKDGYGVKIELISNLEFPNQFAHRIGFNSQTASLISGVSNHNVWNGSKFVPISDAPPSNATLTR